MPSCMHQNSARSCLQGYQASSRTVTTSLHFIMPGSIQSQFEVTNNDDSKLAELGYRPELRRQYSPLALAGIAVVVCNSWGAVGGALITGKLASSNNQTNRAKRLLLYRSW